MMLKHLINKAKQAFSDSLSEEDELDIMKDEMLLFTGNVMAHNSLSYCLSDLFIDGERSGNEFAKTLDASCVEKAKDITRQDYQDDPDCAGEDIDQCVEQDWLQYYVKAVLLKHGLDTAQVENLTEQTEMDFTGIKADVIGPINDELVTLNNGIHKEICSYMGQSESIYTIEMLVACTDYAIENNMVDEQPLTTWLPNAFAQIDIDDDGYYSSAKNTGGPTP